MKITSLGERRQSASPSKLPYGTMEVPHGTNRVPLKITCMQGVKKAL